MAVFDIFRRFKTPTTAPAERREDERLRALLGARVLVVDDSATIRAVLGKMLMQDGYEVLKAADGESAIETARAQGPDLIFLDIVLPGISGFAVLRSLRRDSRTRATPIIMMSGNQQATEQFYVQRFGADGFIKKPFGRAEVFHAIRALVQAGRMAARVESVQVSAIPEGISPEEWNAIPDVAMPDEAHMASFSAEPLSEPARAIPVADMQAAPRHDAAVHAWSVPAASGAMRPSIGSGMQGAVDSGSTPLVLHVGQPRSAPAPATVPDATVEPGETATTLPSHESKD